MNTKHTPGPWTLKWNDQDLTERRGLKGWDILAGPSNTFPGARDCAGQFIGNEANARLIEAAPELLVLLMDARDKMYEDTIAYNQRIGATFDQAEAHAKILMRKYDEVIAKATTA